MILLECDKDWRCGPLEFPAGRWYVENATAGAALAGNEGVRVTTVGNAKPWSAAGNWNGKVVVVGTSGGFGDLLFWTPVFREMKRRWPGMILKVACTPYFHDALRWHPCVDGPLEVYPVPAEVIEEHAAAVIWPEGLMEWSARSRELHYVDCLAEWMGFEELPLGKGLDFTVDEAARERVGRRFPLEHPGVKRVGVQMRASAQCRTYPGELLGEVIGGLLDEGCEVLVFGAPEAGAVDPSATGTRLHWLPWWKPGLTFGESCALLATCDAVVAPDSALCHVAGALGIPTVALFGPYPWELRTKYAKSVRALSGTGACAPCFWNERDGPWPKDGPCAKTGRCEVLARIEPGRVVREVRGKW